VLTQLMSAVPQILQTVTNPPQSLTTIAGAAQLIGGIVSPGQAAVIVTILSSLATYSSYLSGVLDAAGPGAASSPGLGALAARLGAETPALGSAGLGAAASAVSANTGSAGAMGALSVPPSWAAATPMVRLAANVLHGTNAAAAPAVTVASGGSVFGELALASLAGGALGATLPRATSPTATRGARPTTDKNSQTPDKLRRVLADLSQNPESVQHWHTDKAHLETLLDQLSKKPGIHAVHLSAGDKPKATPPKALWG
jgi:hypothetical protein